MAHNNLGFVLVDKGQLQEAIAEYREAIRLKPDYAQAHNNLGFALLDKGQFEEAIAEYREAIRLKPDYAEAHYNLGNALMEKDHLEEASSEYRKAIELKKDFAEAHCNLGRILMDKGQFREALEQMRRGHELGSSRPGWLYPSLQWVRQYERMVELDGKLPDILAGKTKPVGPDEGIELAGLFALKRLNRAAARFYAEAFSADPKLANDLDAAHRYNAACAAALAGCGQGKDADKLDSTERAGLRRQALDWQHADLEAWKHLLDKGPDKVRPILVEKMQQWLRDTDFTGVREPHALAQLPEAERERWQKLWDDVANTLARAQTNTTPEKKSAAK
jgi:tetratricopeptide (TPR) repeat protein